MKYTPTADIIPNSRRQEINDKILYLIDSQRTAQFGITANDVFNSYTGAGGLHGLSRNDYRNFHDFSVAKKEIDNGQHFTPPILASFMMQCLSADEHDIIMDLTGGAGVFINYAPCESNFFLNEVDVKAVKIAKHLYPDAIINHGDIRTYQPDVKADIIVGNPPYNLKWRHVEFEYISQFYYCVKAAELLNPGGLLALIVPCSFLADEFTDRHMIKEIERVFNFICQFDLPSNAFKAMGVDNFPTKMVFMQRRSEYIQFVPYRFEKIIPADFGNNTAIYIHNKMIKPVMDEKNRLKKRLFLEGLHGDSKIETESFEYKARMLLYQVKVHPRTSKKYAACLAYIEKFRTQKPPEGMKYEEWAKVKITPKKVLAYLRKTLNGQNAKPEQDIIRLVKTDRAIMLKAYSRKTKAVLKETPGIKSYPINDLVLDNQYPFDDKQYIRLINRRRRLFELQTADFNELTPDPLTVDFLRKLVIHDHVKNEKIRLSPVQLSDTAKILTKPYGFLQWEQGSGKTISGIAQHMYRMTYNNVFCTFIVSTALSIHNNWLEVLSAYHIDHIHIHRMADLPKIEKGNIALITLDMLIKYERQIKSYVKSHNQRIFLLYDESDTSTSMDSKTSKAVKNCFRRVKFKCEMTGTSTRNNINEFYSQLELLYNNSIHMLCECSQVFYRNKKDNEKLETKNNDASFQPFPAYKKGFTLFQRCFLPEKITVFGVGQHTQDIYNADILKKLLGYTVITRTFEEVTGKRIHEIKQETCAMSEPEKVIYKTAIEEFYKLEYLFAKTGNTRKDAMLRVLNQLLILLRICAAPQTIKEFQSDILPPKFERVLSLLKENDHLRIGVGVRHVSVVEAYGKAIRETFPDRPLFIVTGNKVSIKKRRDIINKLGETPDGILLSTQQSLSEAINCDCVDTCIIPELFWNNAAMSQYYFRFIRYNSTRFKKVIFVTYENSIESNLLQMVMAKEKLNLFMKNQTLEDIEIHEKFGIDFDILQMLMSKDYDEKGHVRIRWGEQKIS
jgi:trans-aconitate methyltransferase